MDITPEQLTHKVLGSGKPDQKGPEGKAYCCISCGKEVAYPDTLFDDGKCQQCHQVD